MVQFLRNTFPGVEKGFKESMDKGPLAGYQVLGKDINDGTYHPVDSSEMAFKIAAKEMHSKKHS